MSETKKVPVDLLDDGLLWLINRVAFHPRGFALAYTKETGEFELWGNGDEAWEYVGVDQDVKFDAVEAAFDRVRETKETD